MLEVVRPSGGRPEAAVIRSVDSGNHLRPGGAAGPRRRGASLLSGWKLALAVQPGFHRSPGVELANSVLPPRRC